MIKTTIDYRNRGGGDMSGFYHEECPVLYGGDIIGKLEDCPFPLETPDFKVLAFGHTFDDGKRDPKYGHDARFAVVECTKSCGHKVQERIPFFEGVETFDHYGTIFTGGSYSINDWKNRIEFFRTILPCDVCQLVKHFWWCQEYADTCTPKNMRIHTLTQMLDYNFNNWRDMVDLEGNPKKLPD